MYITLTERSPSVTNLDGTHNKYNFYIASTTEQLASRIQNGYCNNRLYLHQPQLTSSVMPTFSSKQHQFGNYKSWFLYEEASV